MHTSVGAVVDPDAAHALKASPGGGVVAFLSGGAEAAGVAEDDAGAAEGGNKHFGGSYTRRQGYAVVLV